MNDLFVSLGIESWKAVLGALLLPPVPFLLLVLVGARLIPWRRAVGWLIVLLAVVGLWLGASSGAGEWLQRVLLSPPGALSDEQAAELRRSASAAKPGVVIVVLGGGRESRAPEYGIASLSAPSLERLRYGVWLSREVGAPLAFSGGLGHAAQPGMSEAEVAADIAAREFGRPMRWVETKSRDTRENAQYTVELLREQGVKQLVVVTHVWHMPRAMRAFKAAAARANFDGEIVAAPIGLAPRVERPSLRWIPTIEGFALVRSVVREKLGYWMGA